MKGAHQYADALTGCGKNETTASKIIPEPIKSVIKGSVINFLVHFCYKNICSKFAANAYFFFAAFLRAGFFFAVTFLRVAVAFFRFLLAAFFAGIFGSCRIEKRAGLYID